MWNLIYGVGTTLIIVSVFHTNAAGGRQLQDENRTCIPAEVEPILNSSSCYPLLNFSRPYCENNGVTLPKYVYMPPHNQTVQNYYSNKDEERIFRLGWRTISRHLHLDIGIIKRCYRIFTLFRCRLLFPSCDRTRSVNQKQKICRETCLIAMHTCYEFWKIARGAVELAHPDMELKERFQCKLQPYRNGGDSPECWYDDFTNSADESLVSKWTSQSDCLFLNGSSYNGNISVTASGIPCQSWTEQCPHRHTMNTTYPELNYAKNYCRNPKNSGQRPWCFTTDRTRRWEYCDIPKCARVDGSYGNWTLKNLCNATCGEGFETWVRDCDKPEPKFGGANCSLLGEPVEYRSCSTRPCPVNGGYSNWSMSIPCNVSCDEGVEVWKRTCNKPEPKYGGSNCSVLGSSTESKICRRKPCPIDGNYSNWTKASPCSATCDGGVELWIRHCDNPPGQYGGNCSKRGPDHENRSCKKQPCPLVFDSETIGLIVAVSSFAFITAVTILILFLRKRWKKQRCQQHYAIFRFSSQHSAGGGQHHRHNSTEEGASSLEGNNTSAILYENLTVEGNPAPGHCRGVVPYRNDYMNTRPFRSSLYDRLQVFRPMAVEWLRNAWGNVDEFGHHVYDVMQRNIRQIFVPYDKLNHTRQNDSDESGNPAYDSLEILAQDDSAGTEESSSIYDTLEDFPVVILPTTVENV